MALKIKASNVGNLRGDIKKQQERRESQGERVNFAKWIPHQDDGELRVRFLKNPDNGGWISFEQVYDPSKRGPQILTEENEEYYTEKGIRPSTRFYAPIRDIKAGETGAVEIPYSIVDDILRLGDRWGEAGGGKEGDVTSFDIALYKTGYGKEGVEYHAEFAGFADIDVDQYEAPDLWKILEAKVAFQEGRTKDHAEDATSVIADEVVNMSEPPFEKSEEPQLVQRRVIKRKK